MGEYPQKKQRDPKERQTEIETVSKKEGYWEEIDGEVKGEEGGRTKEEGGDGREKTDLEPERQIA